MNKTLLLVSLFQLLQVAAILAPCSGVLPPGWLLTRALCPPWCEAGGLPVHPSHRKGEGLGAFSASCMWWGVKK